MVDSYQLLKTNCHNCNCEFEDLINITTDDYKENFCSVGCAMEWYDQKRILELRRKKINKIRNGKC